MTAMGWELTSGDSMVDLRPVGPRRFVVNGNAQIATFAKLKCSPKADIHLCNQLDFSMPSLPTQRVL